MPDTNLDQFSGRFFNEDVVARIAFSMCTEPGDTELPRYLGEFDTAFEAYLAFARGDTLGFDHLFIRIASRLPEVEAVRTLMKRNHSQGIGYAVPVYEDGNPAWWDSRLDRLTAPPLILFTKGNPALLEEERSVALVGARAATGYGEHVTMEMSAGLVDRGYTIVSGAAYGIDGMAHRAALASGGNTIAFLAGGVDRFYPTGHDALLQRIAQTGLVVSELPPGTSPTKWRFLQRNRLIAAQSAGLVVIEAGTRSGSLNTAGHSKAIGGITMAVPGPVTSPASSGTAHLLRSEGAICVTSAAEVVETIEGEGN